MRQSWHPLWINLIDAYHPNTFVFLVLLVPMLINIWTLFVLMCLLTPWALQQIGTLTLVMFYRFIVITCSLWEFILFSTAKETVKELSWKNSFPVNLFNDKLKYKNLFVYESEKTSILKRLVNNTKEHLFVVDVNSEWLYQNDTKIGRYGGRGFR